MSSQCHCAGIMGDGWVGGEAADEHPGPERQRARLIGKAYRGRHLEGQEEKLRWGGKRGNRAASEGEEYPGRAL